MVTHRSKKYWLSRECPNVRPSVRAPVSGKITITIVTSDSFTKAVRVTISQVQVKRNKYSTEFVKRRKTGNKLKG